VIYNDLDIRVRLFKVIGTDSDRSAAYDFLLTFHIATMGLSPIGDRPTPEINGDFSRKSQILLLLVGWGFNRIFSTDRLYHYDIVVNVTCYNTLRQTLSELHCLKSFVTDDFREAAFLIRQRSFFVHVIFLHSSITAYESDPIRIKSLFNV